MLPVQCKMARVALGLGVRELADLAEVSPDTVARFERGDALKEKTVATLQSTLEKAGVIFVQENGEGPGVRLRRSAFFNSVATPELADEYNARQDEQLAKTMPQEDEAQPKSVSRSPAPGHQGGGARKK